MSGPLILAVPAKGRLQENAFSFFARAERKPSTGGPHIQLGTTMFTRTLSAPSSCAR